MAELGLILALAGAVDIGTRVSIDLFDFAQKISSASKEIRSVATEISLTCGVFESIKNTISHAPATRHDPTTGNTILGIIERCKEIFTDIQSVLTDLQSEGSPDGEPAIDFLKRVDWAFWKRSKVQGLRNNLDDMKPILMLAMMQIQLSHTLGPQSNLVAGAAERAKHGGNEAKLIESLNRAQNWSNESLKERDPALSHQLSDAATVISGATLWNSSRMTPRPVPRTSETVNRSGTSSDRQPIHSDFRANREFRREPRMQVPSDPHLPRERSTTISPVRRTFTPSVTPPPATSLRPQTCERCENTARAHQTVLAAERQARANDNRYWQSTHQKMQARQLQLGQDLEAANALSRRVWADLYEPERMTEQTHVITLRTDRWEPEIRIARRL